MRHTNFWKKIIHDQKLTYFKEILSVSWIDQFFFLSNTEWCNPCFSKQVFDGWWLVPRNMKKLDRTTGSCSSIFFQFFLTDVKPIKTIVCCLVGVRWVRKNWEWGRFTFIMIFEVGDGGASAQNGKRDYILHHPKQTNVVLFPVWLIPMQCWFVDMTHE